MEGDIRSSSSEDVSDSLVNASPTGNANDQQKGKLNPREKQHWRMDALDTAIDKERGKTIDDSVVSWIETTKIRIFDAQASYNQS